jgi:hypothetical protein
MFSVNSVVLPDPEIGETENANHKVRTSKARSGKIRSTVTTPVGKTLVYLFRNVPTHVVKDLEATLVSSPSLILTIFDHHDRTYNAYATLYSSQIQSRHEDNEVNLTLRRL